MTEISIESRIGAVIAQRDCNRDFETRRRAWACSSPRPGIQSAIPCWEVQLFAHAIGGGFRGLGQRLPTHNTYKRIGADDLPRATRPEAGAGHHAGRYSKC